MTLWRRPTRPCSTPEKRAKSKTAETDASAKLPGSYRGCLCPTFTAFHTPHIPSHSFSVGL